MTIKSFVLFCAIGILSVPLFGQRQHYIDSLKERLSTADDRTQIAIYNNLSWSYKFSKPDLSLSYGLKALKLNEQIGDPELKAISLNRVGAARIQLGELNEALEALLKGLTICNTYNYQKILSTTLRQIGEVYQAQGNTSMALNNYYNSLGLADSLNIPILKARTSSKIAEVFLTFNRKEDAKQYIDYALNVFLKSDYLRGVHQTYLLKGDFYCDQNLLDSALFNYSKALDYLTRLKDKKGYANTIVKIGKVYEHNKKYEDAISNYHEALDTFLIINDKKNIASCYILLAHAYYKLNSFKPSIQFANLAIEEAQHYKLANEEGESYQLLYNIYKTKSEPQKALTYLEKHLIIHDSLANSSQSWRVNQLKKNYLLEMKAKESELNSIVIKNQQLEIKNNRMWHYILISVALLAGILSISIWYSFKQTRRANQQLLLANQEKNEAISLISHDLKSPFNKIKGLAHLMELEGESLGGADKEILEKIESVTQDGLNLVQNLIDIKSLQTGVYALKLSNFEMVGFLKKRIYDFTHQAKTKGVKIEFNESSNTVEINSDPNSIARIFDNLMSNAIKFSHEGETIKVMCSIDESKVLLSISDNGKGIDKKDIERIFKLYETGDSLPTGTEISSGLGLPIVTSLVHKLGGSIQCKSEQGKGATFIVQLPLNSSQIS